MGYRNTTNPPMTVGRGDRYAWMYHYITRKIDWNDAFAFRSCAIELTDRDPCGTRILGREQSQAQPRSRASGLRLHAIVSTPPQAEWIKKRFITIKRACGVLECVCVKRLGSLLFLLPSIDEMDASLKRTAVRESLVMDVQRHKKNSDRLGAHWHAHTVSRQCRPMEEQWGIRRDQLSKSRQKLFLARTWSQA